MSAESPRKSSRQGSPVVAPQPVSDRSIIESVAGFINEVVPQAYTATPQGEGKEAITWARFEYGDINDPALYPDTADDRNDSPPLLLVLGYGSGVQVWAIPANGEATEVLSWRQGIVRTLRILPTPGAESGVTDSFAHKRPLVAICDSAGGPMPQFCSLSFISLRGGDQVKSIKFKNPVSDVLANRRSVVVTFLERIAVFDAATLEDRLTVTTCYPCPGPNPNPVALGSRWLAYTERKLYPAKRSSGGTEGEGVQSYTATMLHAAKSFGKGLRELGETVASSLTGGGTGVGGQRGMGGGVCGTMSGQQGGNIISSNADALQPGVVTIIDAQGTPSSDHIEETRGGDSLMNGNVDNVIAHFLAHSEPIVALQFDPSGMLLLTADKRGHDFHVFRIHPHPGGPSLAAVHHLYVLHRGDTTAKVQDIAFAADSRWVAVSTLRGTTHVFPITPYGGSVGIRTHTTPHVVNRLSRFHRSAGLTADGRNSPLPTPVSETVSTPPSLPYPNPRLPPYSHPTVISPLAQIRQPMTNTLLSNPTAASLNPASQQTYHRNPSMRALGRTQSSADEGPGGGIPLRVTACFAPPRAWLIGSPTVPRDASSKAHRRAVDSLFVMACHGNLIEYDLEPKHAAGIPKEKICDDTPIELEVLPKAQWMLLRPPHSSDLQPPLSPTNPLMVVPDRLPNSVGCESRPDDSDSDERWLSQVEIITHAGPHRRLWMGPQFTFKTYNSSGTSVPVSLLESEAIEVGLGSGSRPARSNPVNMPVGSGTRPVVPVLIESGSGSSYEQSPRLLEAYGTDGADSDGSAGPGENQLREDLADAMMESPGVPTRDTGRRVVVELRQGGQLGKKIWNPIHKVVNPVGTVITVSYPCEELPSSLPSDLNTAITTEHQVSSEQDSRVRIPSLVNLKCVKKQPLMPDNNNKDPLEQASIKWPALAQPTETFSSRPTTGENTDTITAKKSVVLKSKESEGKVQKKGKGIAANLSAKKSDKTQDEERSAGKKGKEIKKDNSGTEIEDKGQNLSWKPNSSEMAKEKISEDKAWEKMETKHKSGSSLTKYTSDATNAATEINITCTTSRETDVKSKIKCSVTSKGKDSSGGVISKKQTTNAANLTLQESSRKIKSVKLEDDTSCESASKIEDMKSLEPKASKRNSKHKSSILISTANDSLEDEVFSESPLKLDEGKSFETKGSKRNTKHKSTNLSPNVEDSYKSVLKVDCPESVKSIEEACKTSDRDPTVAKKLSLLDLADKESTSEIDSRDEFDSLSLDSVKVKKTSLKAKLRQPVVPKYPFADEDKFSGDSEKKDIVEVENLVTFTPETELLPQFTTALSERFSEHHFGIESTSNKYTDDIGFDLIQNKTLKLAFEAGEKCGEHSNLNLGESSKTAQHTAEKRASQGSSDIEALSDVGSQENLLFKSSFDEVFLPPPPKTWSSIVSSSKSSTREKSTSSETLLSKLDVRTSPQRSVSELASSDPSSSLVVQSEESTITDKYSVLQPSKLDDLDDCSDEDKVTIGSNKSQSSDRTSGSDMVTASESLSIVITSESSAATAGNDEDNSQLNEESNGNDDEGLDNGDNSGTSASLGANKKNRRTKKKRR